LEKDGSLRSDQMKAPRVVHAHGFWRGKNMLHTEQQLTGHRPALASSLGRLFQGATVVALGYGGWEDVFTRKLAEMSGDEGEDFELLWTFYPEARHEIEKQLETLQARLSGGLALDRVVLYGGVDGHAVLPALWERLSACSEPSQIRLAESRYRAWAAEQHCHLDLIGLEAGSGRLPLTEVYVSLEATAHTMGVAGGRKTAESALSPSAAAQAESFTGEKVLVLGDDFRFPDGDAPHLAIFGEAGSGKTTALEKLFGLCLKNAEGLGLAQGTLPVFIKLSRLPAELLTGDLEELVAAALEQEGASGGEAAAWLWQRGRLLLLCDGLDEIRDPKLRTSFCAHLASQLGKEEDRRLRAAVSCRREGYGDHVGDLGPTFLHLAVQPLSAGKSDELVEQWFRAVRAAGTIAFGETDLHSAEKELLDQLKDPDLHLDQRRTMVSSPLLLTLLCLLVARGGEMPRHRASFFAEALRLLLGRWQSVRGDRPPISVDRMLALLAPIAWRLHAERSGGKADGAVGAKEGRIVIGRAELMVEIGEGLTLQRSNLPPRELVDWLCERAAILQAVGDGRYAFRHLRFQEYLSALFVASRRGEPLERLLAAIDQDWSREVTALLVGLPGFALFAPVMDRLLPAERLDGVKWEKFFSQLIEEAAELEPMPLFEALERARGGKAKAAVLRRMAGVPVVDRASAQLLLRLVLKASASISALAAQRLREGVEQAPSDSLPLLDESGREALCSLADQLPALTDRNLAVQLEDPVRRLIQHDPLWGTLEDSELYSLGSERRASEPETPIPFAAPPLPGPSSRGQAAGPRAGASEAGVLPIVGEPFTEPATGIRFLWVPGDRFRMGDTEFKAPERDVDVTPFWLAETAVTNDQYGHFLAANKGHAEPGAWRDSRFSDPRQPVVAVSWHDAKDFCTWLASRSGLQVALPEEAQWEFAARSGDGRRYPWGSKAPGDALADYGQDFSSGRPAPVGSFPAGAGPFGHLDLAGGVWEWCKDHGFEPWKDEDGRSLRGGGWADPADGLPSAFRSWRLAWRRLRYVGFRVAVVPPSP
jgi:formylglycine-generating enzyme required for sulfatase activity